MPSKLLSRMHGEAVCEVGSLADLRRLPPPPPLVSRSTTEEGGQPPLIALQAANALVVACLQL